MRARSKRHWILLIGCILLAGCDNVVPTLTPTHALSGPTLVSSPTTQIRTSDEIYGGGTPSFGLGVSDLTAASVPSRGVLPPLTSATQIEGGADISIFTGGAPLPGRLFQRGELRIPGVMLLGQDFLAWDRLPMQIHDAGFTVLALNITANTTSGEIGAALDSFALIGTVDPAHIAVVGASGGADLALIGCVVNPICDTVVLLSPLGRDTLLNILPAYLPRTLMAIAGADDAEAYRTALDLAQLGSSAVRFMQFPSGRGTDLLRNPSLNDEIVAWLISYLPANSPQ